MQIRELYLKNFGKFSDHTFLIRDGINVFYGENEFGKSTLFAFIKGMLFGMERARGRASKNDAFSQYEPWDNPNYYAGVLRFTSGGKNFRIERSFDKITKNASLICEDDGEELSIEHGDLDILLEGMTLSSFENTIAIGQLGIETNQDLATALKNYAANYYESGDSDVNVQQALEHLKERQRDINHEIRHETLQKERMRSRIEQECEYIRRDIEKLKIDEHYAKVSEGNIEEEMVTDETEDTDETGSFTDADYAEMRWRRKKFIPALCLFLILIAAEVAILVFASKTGMDHIVKVLSVVIDILAIASMTALYLAKRYLKKRDQENLQPEEESEEELENSGQMKSRRGRSEKERVQWELGRLRANIHEKQVRLNNLNERLEELEVSGFEKTQADKAKQAVELASETIMRLSDEIIKGFGHSLNETASEIIAAITDGKYDTLYIDETMNMYLLTKQKRVGIDKLSRGTMEQIYFALRMAAMEVLYEEEFPVILDDTFVFYDDARLEAVMKWLAKQKRQVILFTCQKRESAILNQLEIPFGMNE